MSAFIASKLYKFSVAATKKIQKGKIKNDNTKYYKSASSRPT